MAAIPRFLRTRRWRNQDLILYHGTLSIHSAAIKAKVDVRVGEGKERISGAVSTRRQ